MNFGFKRWIDSRLMRWGHKTTYDKNMTALVESASRP